MLLLQNFVSTPHTLLSHLLTPTQRYPPIHLWLLPLPLRRPPNLPLLSAQQRTPQARRANDAYNPALPEELHPLLHPHLLPHHHHAPRPLLPDSVRSATIPTDKPPPRVLHNIDPRTNTQRKGTPCSVRQFQDRNDVPPPPDFPLRRVRHQPSSKLHPARNTKTNSTPLYVRHFIPLFAVLQIMC